MISTPPDIYTDLQGLSRLRNLTRQDSARALDEVARQFEALFLQMVLKGGRDSSFGDPLFGGQQMDFYRDMHDQQLSVELARGGGMGIARMLVEQLGGSSETAGQPASAGQFPVPERLALRAVAPAPASPEAIQPQEPATFDSPQEFVQRLWPDASRAAAELGVSPRVLLAQAALETGWGKKVIQRGSGSSHNLFNIKADRRWEGEKVGVGTLEYIDGSMVRQQAAFRVYGSYADSFTDYVDFLRSNPRYAEALRKAGDDDAFVTALHQAGYATDPRYADKIRRIANGPVLAELDSVKVLRARADNLL